MSFNNEITEGFRGFGRRNQKCPPPHRSTINTDLLTRQMFNRWRRGSGRSSNRLNRYIDKYNQTNGGRKYTRADKLRDLRKKKKKKVRIEQNAPIEEDKAEKAYFVFKDGESGYRRRKIRELRVGIDKIINETKHKWARERSEMKTMTDTYAELLSTRNEMKTYLSRLQELNKALVRKVDVMNNDTQLNDRKVFYQSEGKKSLEWWNYWLRWAYILMVIIYIIALVLLPSSATLRTKVTILLAFIILPFIIRTLVVYAFSGTRRILDVIPYNTYTSEIGVVRPDPNAGRKLHPVDDNTDDVINGIYTDTLNSYRRPL